MRHFGRCGSSVEAAFSFRYGPNCPSKSFAFDDHRDGPEHGKNTQGQAEDTDRSAHQSAANVADALNAVLADTYALYFKTKNFHWHVTGPHFRDYHLMFDAQAAQMLLTTDQIAERIRKTGNVTLRSIGDVVAPSDTQG